MGYRADPDTEIKSCREDNKQDQDRRGGMLEAQVHRRGRKTHNRGQFLQFSITDEHGFHFHS